MRARSGSATACQYLCPSKSSQDAAESQGWELAYALAWLSVAGGNSVMPPWVRHQFPGAGRLVRRLRDTACTDPACDWCRERHDATKELTRWFGYDRFRPEPADGDGKPLQKSVVETAMAGGACPGHTAHRHRKVRLLPGARPLPLRQDRRPHCGDLAPGGSNGRPGGGAGGKGHRLLRHRQRPAFHARTCRRVGPGEDGGCLHTSHLAGAAA